MCGITGFIDFTRHSAEPILDSMRDMLIHRGPDGLGSYFINNKAAQIGLAHRRLSIIDPSPCGAQPMSDPSGKYTIVFNGEVYNFKALRVDLQKKGISFKSNSDTEVVLEAYKMWGMECLEKFIGMFAFALLDLNKEVVILCRDRAGVKPLYYTTYTELFLFGSELKAIMAHPQFEKQIDHAALGSFFKHGWIEAPHSIFKNTYKIKPGHYLQFSLKTKEVKEYCYWNASDYYNMEEYDLTFSDAKDQLEELLKSACEFRMVADTEVGIFLSGGIDSSVVAAILQENRTKKIKTFSVGFNEAEFNEAPAGKAVAAHLGTDHHEIICTESNALDLIPQLPDHYDEPFGDSSAIPTMLVSRFAARSVKVALSADGGDEVFGGYPKYNYSLNNLKKINAIPRIFRKPLHHILSIPAGITISKNPHHQVLLEKIRNTLSRDEREFFRQRSEPMHFSSLELQKLFSNNGEAVTVPSHYDHPGLKSEIAPSKFMMALEYRTILPDDMLVKVDRATMAFSLEGREPLLDHRLLEFSARLKTSVHFNGGKLKALLKSVAYGHIPAALLDRPKKGFSIPTDKWLRNELKELVMDMCNIPFLKSQNIFEPLEAQRMVSNYYKGYDRNAERIWFFLMFQLWYKKWITSSVL
jgi:asparagine synthase (glutamine-hydrolysing)